MSYSLRATNRFKQDLESLDKNKSKRVVKKLRNYFSKNVQNLKKPLSGVSDKYGRKIYSYRIGDLRIIYTLNNQKEVVKLITVGHRREIYDRL